MTGGSARHGITRPHHRNSLELKVAEREREQRFFEQCMRTMGNSSNEEEDDEEEDEVPHELREIMSPSQWKNALKTFSSEIAQRAAHGNKQ